jgi:hypothetical protein
MLATIKALRDWGSSNMFREAFIIDFPLDWLLAPHRRQRRDW